MGQRSTFITLGGPGQAGRPPLPLAAPVQRARNGRREEARAFLRGHADRIVARGLVPALADMTPSARAQAVGIAASTATFDEPVRFDLRDAGTAGCAYAFDVTYVDAAQGQLTLRECIAETERGWRIVHVASRPRRTGSPSPAARQASPRGGCGPPR